MSNWVVIVEDVKIIGVHLPNGDLAENELLMSIPVDMVDDTKYTNDELFAVGEYLEDKKIVNGVFVFSQDAVDQIEVDNANIYIHQEMLEADRQILNYHYDGDERAISTPEIWKQYRKDLRDYVKSGVIETDKPTRPT